MTSGMPLVSSERLLFGASLCLLALAGERLLGGGAGSGAGYGYAADHDACLARPHDVLRRGRGSWTPAAAASAAVKTGKPRTESGQLAANATALPRGPAAGRLDGERVVEVLRAVIEEHAVGTLLHYPCGDMGWAGPVIAAVQVIPACAQHAVGAKAIEK